MRHITLDGQPLSVADVHDVAFGVAKVEVGSVGVRRARDSKQVLDRAKESGALIYGVNTGFGPLKSERIGKEDRKILQENLIRSHAVGVGPPLGSEAVRGAMLLLAASHLRGYSGVDESSARLICDLLNSNRLPTVPSQGSLGASGDLAPLAHVAIHLLEHGLQIEDKLGLSLINGTHVHTALAALCLAEAEILAKAADIACAMNADATLCSNKPFAEAVHIVRAHPNQQVVARNLFRMLHLSELVKSHEKCDEVQDAYSFRCAPQVHGACRNAISHMRAVVEIELQSVTDNPIVVGDAVISAGHFHGEPVGLALDYFKLGVAELASISERRVERTLNKDLNRGLPAFLVAKPGLQSGMMICQYTAAALVSENKVLCHPSCVDSIPTGANQEDHNSMAMNAALHAQRVIENTRRVLAIELLVAAQALDCRSDERDAKPGAGVAKAYQAVRKQSARVVDDRSLSAEIEEFDVRAIVDSVGGIE